MPGTSELQVIYKEWVLYYEGLIPIFENENSLHSLSLVMKIPSRFMVLTDVCLFSRASTTLVPGRRLSRQLERQNWYPPRKAKTCQLKTFLIQTRWKVFPGHNRMWSSTATSITYRGALKVSWLLNNYCVYQEFDKTSKVWIWNSQEIRRYGENS